MKYPIRLTTFFIAVAWITTGIVALVEKNYLIALVALVSVGYAFEIALYLRDLAYARRRQYHSQTRTDKEEPHP